MEKADPDDLSVEVTTFHEEEEKSSEKSVSSILEAGNDDATDGQNHRHNHEQSFFDYNNERFNNLRSKLFDEVLELPKEIRNIIAGGFAGMIAKSIVAPFDRIKILYQVSSAKFYLRNIPAIARRIIKEEGSKALWKSNTATMIRVFPYSGIQFMVFDRCKTYVLREQECRYLKEASRGTTTTTTKPRWGLSPIESLFAGMTAGAVSVVATYPLDLTRAQLAVLRLKTGKLAQTNMGFGQVLQRNYLDRGVKGLFRGITPTLLGILPYSGFAFSFNEQAKRRIQDMTGRDLTTIERMQCGALSGLIAQTITYPIEVTRRRMQTIGIVATSGKDAAVDVVGKSSSRNQAMENAIRAVTPDHPPRMSTIIRELYQEQGVRGFFKGVTLNWFKGPVAFSISFTCFDLIQSFLETDAERRFRLHRRASPVTN